MADGSIAWVRGCYSLDFEGKLLSSIKHCGGHVVKVLEHNISCDYVLTENWSDWSASFTKAPFPPIRLHLFFSEPAKTGPYTLQVLTSKCKEWKSACDWGSVSYESERQKSMAGSASTTSAKEQLKAMSDIKKGETLKRARAKAVEALNAKKAKQTIKLVGVAKLG